MQRSTLFLAVCILITVAFLRISQLHTYPPGPHYDEAANVLITRSIAFGGANLFPIANSYQGRESLYFYLNVPLFRLIVDDIFSMRLASVYINLLTVAASIGLGRVMFSGRRGQIIGLVIGLTMAASFHQVFMSRQAFRAVTLPMMQAVGLFFLWHGLSRTGRKSYTLLITAGFFCAGALYTYMASRLFPLWLLLAGIYLLWIDRKQWRIRLSQGVVFFIALGVFSLPLVIYAAQNPDVFFQRLTEVTGGEYHASLSESIVAHLKMFFIEGDHGNLRYNAPHRPYFTWPEGLLLIIGWVVACSRMIRAGHPVEKIAYFMAVLSPLMVIPSVVATGEIPPSHMRSLGMVPLIFVLIGVGTEWFYTCGLRLLQKTDLLILPRSKMTPVAALIFLVLLVGLSANTHTDYFRWATRIDLFYQADGDLAVAAKWLNAQPDAPTYVAAFHREHPTLMIEADRPITWLGEDSLILPPEGEEGLVLFAHDLPSRQNWLDILGTPLSDGIPVGPDGGPAFWAYRVQADEKLPDFVAPALPVHNDVMTYLGAQYSTFTAGEAGKLVMAWHIDQNPPYSQLRPILSVLTQDGIQISTSDAFPRQTDHWQPGEVLFQQMSVNVPTGTPPGQYRLELTWVDRITETFLPFRSENGAFAGISAEIGTIEVVRPSEFPSPDTVVVPVEYGQVIAPGIRLIGWDELPTQKRPGESFDTVFYWYAEPASERASVEGRISLQGDHILSLDGNALDYDPTKWIDGELIISHHRWHIPRDVGQGEYHAVLQVDGQSVELGQIRIEGLPRVFQSPEVDTLTDTEFSDNINLYGYTLKLNDGVPTLSLVWYARDLIAPDYSIFVHMVNSDGVIVEQRDSMPIDNSYPTSLWVVGEYVSDEYTFSMPLEPGYAFRVGLYIQSSGIRQKIIIDGIESDYEYMRIEP